MRLQHFMEQLVSPSSSHISTLQSICSVRASYGLTCWITFFFLEFVSEISSARRQSKNKLAYGKESCFDQLKNYWPHYTFQTKNKTKAKKKKRFFIVSEMLTRVWSSSKPIRPRSTKEDTANGLFSFFLSFLFKDKLYYRIHVHVYFSFVEHGIRLGPPRKRGQQAFTGHQIDGFAGVLPPLQFPSTRRSMLNHE